MTDAAFNRLLEQVEQIDNNEDLDAIFESLKLARRNIRDAQAADVRRTLKVGDKVVLAGALSPKYLIGLTGVVAARPSAKRVKIKLDFPSFARRYARADGSIEAPLTCVEKG